MVAIDVGNTSLHYVVFRGTRITRYERVDTVYATLQSLRTLFKRFAPEGIIVSSVVPEVTKLFVRLQKESVFMHKLTIVGRDIFVPVKSNYNKNMIGMDRLVAAYAAIKLNPKTRFVLDFGTAITFDVLSKDKVYEGGFILPGIGSTLKVLSNCALLPNRVVLKAGLQKNYNRTIPTETTLSIQRGLQEGFTMLINSFVRKYSQMLKVPDTVPVVVTGGDARYFLSSFDFNYFYEPFLVAKGLFYLHNAAFSPYRPKF